MLNDPPDTEMSPTAKFDVASLEVKVKAIEASLEVSPVSTVEDVIVIVNAVESKSQLNWVAAVLVLPTASLKPPAATSIVTAPSVVGVKVAV